MNKLSPETGEAAAAAEESPADMEAWQKPQRFALIIGAGWLGTNLGIAIADLPLKFLLKDTLHLSPAKIAGFFAIGAFTNYIKPLAGILADSIPLFGTRRKYYLVLSLLFASILWVLLSLVPRNYDSLLVTYAVLYLMIVFTSTTLGGVMVEFGQRFQLAGRLTAQRIGIFRVASLAGGPIGGALAYYPFTLAMGVSAALHFALVPLYFFCLREPPVARLNQKAWQEAARQGRLLLKSKTLLSAAGLVFLLAASPGFGTPLLFYQTDTLHFTKQFIGVLVSVSAFTGLLAAIFYHRACRRLNLYTLLAASIVVHALGTLCYLSYHTQTSAIVITALSGVSGTLAMLPIYDLAARATPRGSEAIGYSVMMSMWNLTNALSDWSGSWLYSRFHLTFIHLVWINAGTTALVLFALPLLPAVLMSQKDGDT